MPKRLVNALTMLSAVVCVLSLMLVGRSVVRIDLVTVPIGQNNMSGVATIDGHFVVGHTRRSESFSHASTNAATFRPALDRIWGGLSGIRWLRVGWGTDPSGTKLLILPLWLLPLLTAIGPVRWRRNRRGRGARGFPVAAAEH